MSKYTEPDFSKACLITIDTQCDTLDGQPMEIPGTSAILPKIKVLLKLFREKGLPIVHIVRIYKPDGSNIDLCRKDVFEKGFRVFLPNTEGCQLPLELKVREDLRLECDLLLKGEVQTVDNKEYIIYKPRWGAFYQTPLEDLLATLEVNTLVFCGANYPNCLRSSIYEASERDYRLVLVEDAISAFYERGKIEMENIGVNIINMHKISERVER